MLNHICLLIKVRAKPWFYGNGNQSNAKSDAEYFVVCHMPTLITEVCGCIFFKKAHPVITSLTR